MRSITFHVRSFILISLSCVLGTAAANDIGSGQTRDLVLDSTSEITFEGPVRCKVLRIVGKPVVRSKSEVRESRDASTSGVVQIACDEIQFADGAQLRTWSNVRLFAGLMRGKADIFALRRRDGTDGARIDTDSSRLAGAHGPAGGAGGNGEDAGTGCCPAWSRSAQDGGGGGHGGNGGPGGIGQNGRSANPGESNVEIIVHVVNFEGTAPILIDNQGGVGGAASDGQNGGRGGNGGAGGPGGRGGKADTLAGRSRSGGSGGNGGIGGNGGNGGNGGDGGKGGDGGRIEMLIKESVEGKGVRPAQDSQLANSGGFGGTPGLGGSGGKGGVGGGKGAGGAGGDGDKIIYGGGHDGGPGADGQPGLNGRDGLVGKWGERGKKGETKENIFGYSNFSTPTAVKWD